MKMIVIGLLLLWPLLSQSQPIEIGAFSLRVGVVMKSGDVKPVPRAEFLICTNSLRRLYDLALVEVPSPKAEDYCVSNLLSKELTALLKQTNWDFSRFRNKLLGRTGNDQVDRLRASIPGLDDSMVYFSIEEIEAVPELRTAFRAEVEDKNSYANVHYQLDVRLGGKRIDVRMESRKHFWPRLPHNIFDLGGDYERSVVAANASALYLASKRLVKTSVLVLKTDLSGSHNPLDLPPGDHWISNCQFTSVGNSKILWDFPLKIEAGKTNQVELSNDNCWKIE